MTERADFMKKQSVMMQSVWPTGKPQMKVYLAEETSKTANLNWLFKGDSDSAMGNSMLEKYGTRFVKSVVPAGAGLTYIYLDDQIHSAIFTADCGEQEAFF